MSKLKFSLLIIAIFSILIGCHFPNKPWVLVEITNLEEGQQVLLDEETHILVRARSSLGIDRVEFFLNGEKADTISPPMGHPREQSVDFSFIPQTEKEIIVSALAVDSRGTFSEPISIILKVVASIEEISKESTPTPTVTSEELAQTQTAQASCINSATFIEHVTIPENTQISISTNFTKIWRIHNNGTCNWSGYQLVQTSGNYMGANSPIGLPPVKKGANADIIIDMVAPQSSGNYSAIWNIQAVDGTIFGPELTVVIMVPQPPTNTPAPTTTHTKSPSQTPTQTPLPTQTSLPTITFTPTPLTNVVLQINEQFSIPAKSSENKTLTCPAESIVVSGGFSDQADVQVWQSMKSGNGWRIAAANSHATAINMTITATCLFIPNGTSGTVSAEKIALPNELTQIAVTCPTGSPITGGGWATESNQSLKIFNSTKSGNGWQLNIYNPTANSPKIIAYAICLSGVTGTTQEAESTGNMVPPNSQISAQINCPGNSIVVGGGFSMDKELILFNTSKEANGWINFATNPNDVEKRLDSFAICYQP